MGMAYFDKINPSIYGRRFGLQSLSSGQYGGSYGRIDLAIGAEDVRKKHSTGDTTATNLAAFGVSLLTTAQGSSSVFTLDPPIPGVQKTVVFGTTGNTLYLKSANGESFQSSQGSTMTVLTSSQNMIAAVVLTPLSTAAWAVSASLSSAYVKASTTT